MINFEYKYYAFSQFIMFSNPNIKSFAFTLAKEVQVSATTHEITKPSLPGF